MRSLFGVASVAALCCLFAAPSGAQLPIPFSLNALNVPKSSAITAPAGWVNIGGFIVPAIAGVTTQTSPTPSWVNFGGVQLPPLPGITTPANGTTTPGATTGPARSCSSIVVGGEHIQLDCLTPRYALVSSAASIPIARSTLAGAGTLPTNVDHRTSGLEGPVRSQGPVGACTAFSFAAAVDHAMARRTGHVTAASVMHVWARYHSPFLESVVDANRSRPISTESSWPYDAKTACSWDTPCGDECMSTLAVTSCASPDTTRVATADGHGVLSVSTITKLDEKDMAAIKDVLAKDQDIWIAMSIDGTHFGNVHGSNAVVPNGDFTQTGSGHAMVLAGYAVQPSGTFYLIHNSWGESWGDKGYAWIREDTLKTNIVGAYLVDVTPSNATPTQPNTLPHPTAPTSITCAAGQKPDSIRGTCVSACTDGSPQHAGTCPTAGTCAAGHVTIGNECVVSPPVTAGRDPKTGIAYECAGAGCTYVVPQNTGGCTQLLCARSCPAPSFHLALTPTSMSCAD